MKSLRLLRTQSLTKANANTIRGEKNPWDNILGFPYTPSEDHVEPKDEEIIRINNQLNSS